MFVATRKDVYVEKSRHSISLVRQIARVSRLLNGVVRVWWMSSFHACLFFRGLQVFYCVVHKNIQREQPSEERKQPDSARLFGV